MSIPKPRSYDWRKDTKPENKSRLSNSRTVPGRNYTIRELLDKFTSGQPINGMVQYLDFDGEYENSKNETPDFEGFLPHPNTLDLVDRQLMEKRIKEELKTIKTRQKDRDDEISRAKSAEQKKIDELTQKIQSLEKPVNSTGGA